MAGNVLREEVFSRRRCGGLWERPSSLRRGKPPHTLRPGQIFRFAQDSDGGGTLSGPPRAKTGGF